MKILKIRFGILFIFISLFSFAQEFPTRGEIYDYEIGDVFHTTFFGSAVSFGMSDKQGITIIGKYYSENADTVFYIQEIIGVINTSDEPFGQYYEEIEIIFFTNLNDTIEADTLTVDPELYNGRSLISIMFYDEMMCLAWDRGYVEGLGCVFENYDNFDSENPSYSDFVLVYFKKGDEVWGEELILVGVDENIERANVLVYPNPVQNQLNIECDFREEINIQIYNSLGQLMDKTTNSSSPLAIDVDRYLSGIYFVQIVGNDGISIEKKKFIKN